MPKTLTVTALQGETIDALVWRVLGADVTVVGDVLNLNRGLAALGPVLPEGTPVTLPVKSAPAVATRETVQLWD